MNFSPSQFRWWRRLRGGIWTRRTDADTWRRVSEQTLEFMLRVDAACARNTRQVEFY